MKSIYQIISSKYNQSYLKQYLTEKFNNQYVKSSKMEIGETQERGQQRQW